MLLESIPKVKRLGAPQSCVGSILEASWKRSKLTASQMCGLLDIKRPASEAKPYADRIVSNHDFKQPFDFFCHPELIIHIVFANGRECLENN